MKYSILQRLTQGLSQYTQIPYRLPFIRIVGKVWQRLFPEEQGKEHIVISLDRAELSSTVLTVSGWALSKEDQRKVKKIRIYFGSHFVGNARYGAPRHDIGKKYAAIAGSTHSGFHFEADIAHYLQYNLNKPVITAKAITSGRQSNETSIPCNIVKTLPLSEEQVFVCHDYSMRYHDFLSVSGWAIAESGIERVEVYLNDQFLGQAEYGNWRGDVGDTYPVFKNSSRSGFYFATILDNPEYQCERQEILIKATSHRGAREETIVNVEMEDGVFSLRPLKLDRPKQPSPQNVREATTVLRYVEREGVSRDLALAILHAPTPIVRLHVDGEDAPDTLTPRVSPENFIGAELCLHKKHAGAHWTITIHKEGFEQFARQLKPNIRTKESHRWKPSPPPQLIVYVRPPSNGAMERQEYGLFLTGRLPELSQKYLDTVGLLQEMLRHQLCYVQQLCAILGTSQVEEQPPILLLDQSLGGGANAYRQQFIMEQVSNARKLVLLTYNHAALHYSLTWYHREQSDVFALYDMRDILDVLSLTGIQEIIVNNLVSLTDITQVFEIIQEIVRRFHCRLTILIHDYYLICPSYALINDREEYCGVPSLEECRRCLVRNRLGHIPGTQPVDIREWRTQWQAILQSAEKIIGFSHSSREILRKAYPDIPEEKFQIVPHKVDYLEPVVIHKSNSNTLHIGVLGTITVLKGSRIIRSLVRLLEEKQMSQIKICVIGELYEELQSPYLLVTGQYRRENLVDLVKKYEIDLFFIPSICPETFSYTTEEIIQMNLPVAVFNLGAQAEKISRYEKGIILHDRSPAAILDVFEAWHQHHGGHPFTYPIFHNIDHADFTWDGLKVAGWAAAECGIQTIEVYLDDVFIGKASYGAHRPDVKNFYPFLKGSGESGYHLYKIIADDDVQADTRTVRVDSISQEGRRGEVIRYVPTRRYLYQQWIFRNEPDALTLFRQRHKRFRRMPKISILTVLREPLQQSVIEMLTSVIKQTYRRWELCLLYSGEENDGTRAEIVKQVTQHDRRVKLIAIPESQSVAQALNIGCPRSTGEFCLYLPEHDLLAPDALFEIVRALNQHPEADLIYSDEDAISQDGQVKSRPLFKPDWSPDYFRSYNYIKHALVWKRSLFEKLRGFREQYKEAFQYDFLLRGTAYAVKILHIPKILYHHREQSHLNTPQNPMTFEHEKAALSEYFQTRKEQVHVEDGLFPGAYNVVYELNATPTVSIIIPNKDHADDLETCLRSILERTTYTDFEILVIENGSREEKTFTLYEKLKSHQHIRILSWDKPFNYAAMNNMGVRQAQGEVMLFLNNDMEVINADWLERMLQHALRNKVGAVGAKLYYPDNTIQHGGTIIGIHGIAGPLVGHAHRYFSADSSGYMGRLQVVQNFSAVTAACLMVRRAVFDEVNGFDERYSVGLNDVDFCLKLRQKDYMIVWTPYAELYHDESATRGAEDSPEKTDRLKQEAALFQQQWREIIKQGEPYYNSNLTLHREDFSLNIVDFMRQKSLYAQITEKVSKLFSLTTKYTKYTKRRSTHGSSPDW